MCSLNGWFIRLLSWQMGLVLSWIYILRDPKQLKVAVHIRWCFMCMEEAGVVNGVRRLLEQLVRKDLLRLEEMLTKERDARLALEKTISDNTTEIEKVISVATAESAAKISATQFGRKWKSSTGKPLPQAPQTQTQQPLALPQAPAQVVQQQPQKQLQQGPMDLAAAAASAAAAAMAASEAAVAAADAARAAQAAVEAATARPASS